MKRTFIGLLILLAGLVTIACNRPVNDYALPKNAGNSTVTGAALVIQTSESPAGTDSREPELTVTADGRVILSWVQKVGDKRYALRFATRDASGWSPARTVAEGENWFVNWADFPSVIGLKNGSLAAHWLVKSGSSTYAYDVHIAQSKDGGQTWGKPVIPHTDLW